MRKKNKILLLIITLGLIFAVSNVNRYNVSDNREKTNGTMDTKEDSNLKSPKTSDWWNNFTFIHIDGNWSTAAGYEWCTGDGSWGNPYIIENITMDAASAPTGSGILIENSKNDYFMINNCTIYNAGSTEDDAGIKLENTNNGFLTNNNCSNNGGNGIFLVNYCENNTISGNNVNDNNVHGIMLRDHCNNNTILRNTASNIMTSDQYSGILLIIDCDENTISGNTAQNNGAWGICLWLDCDNNTISGNTASNEGTSNQATGIKIIVNSKNNTISGNLIRNNIGYGIDIRDSDCKNNLIYQNSLIGTGTWHARDSGTNNHWNTSIIGNYWDNHTAPDNNNDGIVEDPYTWISGTAGSVDYFPLAESPVHEGEKIHIDDSGASAWNWSKTAKLKVWCTGSGTYSNRYVIDGLEINGGGTGSCILIENSEVYFLIKDCIVYNSGSAGVDAGIKLENSNNGTLRNNNCSNNYFGILLFTPCENNTILGNTVNQNADYGIILWTDCVNNTILGNTANDNTDIGIAIYECENNTISGNTAGNDVTSNQKYGIALTRCYNNKIKGNVANNNTNFGIYLNGDCDVNTISGNTVNENGLAGIYIWGSDNNVICQNIINNNNRYGIFLSSGNDNNNITENYIYHNKDWGINISIYGCNNQIIKRNVLVSTHAKFINDGGTNTIFISNYFGTTLPSFEIDVIAQSYSTTEFIITINISSQCIGLDVPDLSIQMWWNGIVVTSNKITELENGLYILSLTRIFVEPDGDPILLNMIISEANHWDTYYETYIAVEAEIDVLCVDIIKHCYSEEWFNMTFYVFDASNPTQGIEGVSWSLWWNGSDVSADIIPIGGGNYSISLKPITVQPGENPIRLNGDVLATGFEQKVFEFFIAVDPEIIDKGPSLSPPPNGNGNGNPPPPPPPPWELYITITTISAGSVAIIVIAWKKDLLAKLKRKK